MAIARSTGKVGVVKPHRRSRAVRSESHLPRISRALTGIQPSTPLRTASSSCKGEPSSRPLARRHSFFTSTNDRRDRIRRRRVQVSTQPTPSRIESDRTILLRQQILHPNANRSLAQILPGACGRLAVGESRRSGRSRFSLGGRALLDPTDCLLAVGGAFGEALPGLRRESSRE